MSWKKILATPKGFLLALVIALQVASSIYFVTDVVGDIARFGDNEYTGLHIMFEVMANISLIAGIVVGIFYLRRLSRQYEAATRALSVASGELSVVIEAYFTEWGLTRAEADIATFTIKGYSIAEVARMRNSAEGTIKTHLNAIYRKAGVAGRAQLVSLLIEDLLTGKIGSGRRAEPEQRAAVPVPA